MPAIPLIAMVAGGAAGAAGGLTALGITSAVGGAALGAAAGGAISSLSSANSASKAAKNFAAQPAPQTDIAALQQQTQQIAEENAARSAALERQYNPGAQELRTESLDAVRANIPESERSMAIAKMVQDQAGLPLSNTGYDSPLLRDAIARAQADLQLGGEIPLDVRNMVTRGALARSGQTSGGLNLGRDLQARDLGLTSLDLSNRRLQNAAQLGQYEAALEQANAQMRMAGEQYGRDDLFRSAGFLSNIDSGNFARALSAAQLGQSIQAPQSGLDPSSAGNIAIGNTNAAANKAQQAAALKIQADNANAQAYGQLAGLGVQAFGAFNSPSAVPQTNSYVPNFSATYSPPIAQSSSYAPVFNGRSEYLVPSYSGY